jgi:hypothetical protein
MVVPVHFAFPYVFEGTLNKLIPFMIRQSHHLCSWYERVQCLAVRPELVEGLIQGLFGLWVIDKPLYGGYRS